jgi:hypothetical protein
MTIRSTVVVGLLVLGSGALALAQGFQFPGQRAGAPNYLPRLPLTTLTTSPLFAHAFVCKLINVGNSPLSVSNQTMKFFDSNGTEQVGSAFFSLQSDCEQSLQPGHFCYTSLVGVTDGFTVLDVYCQISFFGNSDHVRGSMVAYNMASEFPGTLVEAR